MSELMLCPFCGGGAEDDFSFFRESPKAEEETVYTVTCLTCGAEAGMHQTREESVAAWNRRVGDSFRERTETDAAHAVLDALGAPRAETEDEEYGEVNVFTLAERVELFWPYQRGTRKHAAPGTEDDHGE